MDQAQTRKVILDELSAIAPEVDTKSLASAEKLRNQVDLDSYDWLQFLIALNRRLNIEIPEQDYARLATIDDLVVYLSSKGG